MRIVLAAAALAACFAFSGCLHQSQVQTVEQLPPLK
jgi:hypothetical protein